VRIPSGAFDHYLFSHPEPAEKNPKKNGQDTGKTVIDK